MGLSARALKIASGAGTLLVCGLSGTVVAMEQKPAAAPLHPPLTQPAPGATSAALNIPPSTCANHPKRSTCTNGTTSAGNAGAVTPNVVDASPGTQPLVNTYVS